VAGGSGIVGARLVGKVVAVEAGFCAEVGELDLVEAFYVPSATHLLPDHLLIISVISIMSADLVGVEQGDHFVDHSFEHLVFGDVFLAFAEAEFLVGFVLPEGEFAVALVEHQLGYFVGEEGVA
jgi:hypothetical protein